VKRTGVWGMIMEGAPHVADPEQLQILAVDRDPPALQLRQAEECVEQ